MNKILLIYNICGINKDNTDIYPQYLDKIVAQKFNGELKIIVSACQPKERTIPSLKSIFPQCYYNVIHDKVPVNVSFNHSVLEGIKKFGKFDAYVYITCDSVFQTVYDIDNLFNIINNNPMAGMVSARVDRDSCYTYGNKWGPNHPVLDIESEKIMFASGDWIMPVGNACAAHVNMYSSKIQEYYGECIPSCMRGYCTESLNTMVTNSIGLRWIISKDILVRHTPSLDIPSAGFRPEAEDINHIPTYYQGFPNDDISYIFGEEYASLGGCLEECQEILLHDKSQWTEDGCCKNDKLKEYIKKHFYISNNGYDYNKINSSFQ